MNSVQMFARHHCKLERLATNQFAMPPLLYFTPVVYTVLYTKQPCNLIKSGETRPNACAAVPSVRVLIHVRRWFGTSSWDCGGAWAVRGCACIALYDSTAALSSSLLPPRSSLGLLEMYGVKSTAVFLCSSLPPHSCCHSTDLSFRSVCENAPHATAWSHQHISMCARLIYPCHVRRAWCSFAAIPCTC